MFVIVNDQNVILGPMDWRKLFFENIILEECEVTVELPYKNTEPFIVNDNIKILPATYTEDAFNSNIQKLNGPFWTLSATSAVGHFVAVPKDLDHIRSDLKELVAQKRWEKEVAGVKVTLNGSEYTAETDRDVRNLYTQAVLSGQSTNWKFKEGFVFLTQADLSTIVTAVVNHVNGCFLEESNRIVEIESISDVNLLNNLFDTYNPKVQDNGL